MAKEIYLPETRNVTRSRLVLLELQNTILGMIAKGASLNDTLSRMCLEVEMLLRNVTCSVVGIDATGKIRPMVGPNLPDAFSQAIEGESIGPAAGSCGTAAYLATDVVVVDIENDPLWSNYKHLALPHSLRACWSRLC